MPARSGEQNHPWAYIPTQTQAPCKMPTPLRRERAHTGRCSGVSGYQDELRACSVVAVMMAGVGGVRLLVSRAEQHTLRFCPNASVCVCVCVSLHAARGRLGGATGRDAAAQGHSGLRRVRSRYQAGGGEASGFSGHRSVYADLTSEAATTFCVRVCPCDLTFNCYAGRSDNCPAAIFVQLPCGYFFQSLSMRGTACPS